MEHEFDEQKNISNIEKHGVDFNEVDAFEWNTAQLYEDTRKNYAEKRFQALGYIGKRLYFLVFCIRGEKIRLISLRKANKREEKFYAEA